MTAYELKARKGGGTQYQWNSAMAGKFWQMHTDVRVLKAEVEELRRMMDQMNWNVFSPDVKIRLAMTEMFKVVEKRFWETPKT